MLLAALLATLLAACVGGPLHSIDAQDTTASLEVGFGEADITPDLQSEGPVWLAGYSAGRKAVKVHDPIMARCIVLKSGDSLVAWISVDLVGMQLPDVQRVRAKLDGFEQVIISSTHNHEGPDVIGLWGSSLTSRGVNDKYLSRLVDTLADLTRETARRTSPAKARFGTAADERLLRDSRKPYVKDATLRLLRFEAADGGLLGAVVQWNCHPEAMGSKNKELTADFTGVTVAALKERWQAPVVLISGAVGGLMAPPSEWPGFRRQDAADRWEYMTAYGKAVAKLAEQAMAAAQKSPTLPLTPMRYTAKPVAIPIDNAYYRTAQSLGVLQRQQTVWMGDPWNTSEKPSLLNQLRRRALVTEVGWLECGELLIACVPGELYPELVTGEFQDPIESNVDYPDAPREPSIVSLVGDRPWMLFGLCNDEIGYLIPKSQWDHQAPYAYGRTKSQYGEINSCSVEAGPIIMEALRRTLPQQP